MNDIESIFENALKDPELFSTIDIENLLKNIENDKTDYLENKTLKTISDDIFYKINDFHITDETKEIFCNKLAGYRYVDEIRELHKGTHTRWIRKTNYSPTLTNGGTLVNIVFNDKGTTFICRGYSNKFFQCKFDDCLVFQKLSLEEQLILMAYEYIEKKGN